MYTYYCTQSEFETINQASLPSDKIKNYKNQPMYFLPKGNRYQILVPVPLISTSIQKNECVIYLPCSGNFISGTGTGTLARITTSHGKKSSLVKSDSTK